MPKPTLKFALAVVAIAVAIGWLLRPGKYLRFKHQSGEYYATFAAACDSMLAHYSLGTNGFLEISGAGEFLPRMVRDLHPWRIKVSTNWVWILVNGSHSRDGLVSVWEPQYDRTNMWNLGVGTGEGETAVVYVRKH